MMGDQGHLQTKEMSVRSEETSTSKSTITINNRRFVKNNPNRPQSSEIKTNADLKQQPDNVYVEQLSARKSKVTEDTLVEINFRTSLAMTDGPRRPKGTQMVQVKGSLRAGWFAPDLHSSKTACHLAQDCADDEGGLSSSKEDPIYETKDKENNTRQRNQHCARLASAILRPGAHSKTKDIEQTVRTADAEWTDLSTHHFQSDEQSTSINTALKPSDATVAASYRKIEKPVKEEHCLYSLSQYVYHGTSSQQKSGEPTVCRYCIPAAHSRADHRKFHNGNAQNCAKTIRRGSTKATMTCAVDDMRCLDSMSEENNLDVIITSEIGSTGELEPKQSGSGTEGERIPPNRNGFLFSSIKKVDMSFDHDGTTERSVTDSKMSIAFQQCSLADTVSTILDYPLDATTTLQTHATSQALQRELMSTSPKTETTSKMLQTKTTSNTHQTEVTSETYRTETSSKILKTEANSKTHQTGAVSATLETEAMSETQQTEATPTTLQTEAMWETHQTGAMSETQQTESTSKMLQTEVMSKAHQAEAMSKILQTVVATKALQTETASTLAGQRCNVTALLEEGGSKKDNREEADNAAGSTWFVFFEKPTVVRDISSSLLPGEPADKAEFKTNADNKQSSMSLERRQYYDVEGHSMLLNSTGDCSAPSPVNYENLRHLHDVLARKPDHEFYTDCGKSASLRHIEAATVDVIILNPSSAIPRSQLVFWEIWRLSTFSALEDLAVFAIRLAQTGFYYDEELDEIRCFSCNVSKRRWSKTEYPALVHLVLSPECNQANMADRRNVPISIESQVLLPTTEGSADSGKGADVLQQDSDQTDASASTQSMPSAAVDPTSVERRNLQNDSKERAVSAGPAAARGTNADGRSNEPISTTAGRLPSLPQPSAQNQTLPTQNSLVGLPSGSVASAPQVKTASPSAGPPSQNSTTSSAPTVSKPLGAGEQSPSRYPVQVEQAPYATPNQRCHSHGSFEDSGVQEDNQETADGDGHPATGGLDMRRAINPAYATVSKRMATFSDWPSTGKPSSRVLVLAGFHYTGIGDSVRCFYCGVMLRNWRHNDDPWVAHVRFRFSCDYILTIKGESFVRETQVALARRQATAPQEQNEGESTSCTAQAGGNTTRAATPTSAASTATTATNQNRNPPPTSTPSANTNMPRSASPSQRTTRNNSNHPDERRGASDIGNKGKSQQGSTSSHPASTLTVDGDTAGTTTTLLPQVMSTTVAAGGQQVVTVQTALHGGNHSPPVNPGLLSSPPQRADGGGQREGTQNSRMNGENREGRMSARSELDNRDQEQYLQELQNSNRRLRQTHDCRLCRRRAVNILFLPCGHLCSCDVCATTITNCPLCDEVIGGTARVSFQ